MASNVAGVSRGDGAPKDLARTVLAGLERAGLPLLLLIMILWFSLGATGAVFTSEANVKTILANQAVTGLVALAMVVPLCAGYFDLSVGAVTGVANLAVAATIGTHQWPIALGLLFGVAIGAGIGVFNGFMVAKLRLNGFVATLGTYTLLLGLCTLYSNGEQITQGIPASFGAWGSETTLGLPRPFLLLLVVAWLVWYVMTHTPYGRYLDAIGSNERAASLVGIDTKRVIWISFILSGALAAAAGALQTSRAGGGDPSVGTAFLFPALAAVFLGATTIKPGKYNVWGTIVGVYFVAVSVSGFTLKGADVWVQPVFNGGSLILAVALSTLIARRREHRQKGGDRTSDAPPTDESREPPPTGPRQSERASDPSGAAVPP